MGSCCSCSLSVRRNRIRLFIHNTYIVIYIDWMTTTTQGRNDPQKILFAAFQVFDFAGMVESVEEEVTVSGRPPPTRTST